MNILKTAKSTAFYALLLFFSFIFLFPFAWMIVSSLKSDAQIFGYGASFFPNPVYWENYPMAFQFAPLGRYYLNSLYVSCAVALAQVITSAMAAYVFAKLYFPLKNGIFLVYLGIMMIPSQVTIIPLFILMRRMGLIDTYASLILPFLAYPYGAFLLRQFFHTIPVDLEEAARIDGCSRLWILARIIVPLSKAAMITLAMLSFLWNWNSFFWPLVAINSRSKYTLQLGIAMLRSEVTMTGNWGMLMAASAVTIVPILIFLVVAQKFIIKGISLTGLKS